MRVHWSCSLYLFYTLFTAQIGGSLGRAKGRIHGDFEFEDQVTVREESKSGKEGKKSWIMDPQSDLCQALKCDLKKEMCLLEDEFTAVCVNKADLQGNWNLVLPKEKEKSRAKDSKEYDEDSDYYIEDEDDDDDDDEDNVLPDTNFDTEVSRPVPKVPAYKKSCPPCPVARPTFLCGSDNRTYSSLCRLDYHNCIQERKISAACKGFCPCKTIAVTKLSLKKQAWETKKEVEKKKDLETIEMDKMESSKSSTAKARFSSDSSHKAAAGIGKKNRKVSSDKDRNHNEVINTKTVKVRECGANDLISIGNRLVDWFSVIRKDVKKLTTRRSQGTEECKPEVRWMFDYLNLNSDDYLSLQELIRIENGRVEECVGAFVRACDLDKNDQTTPAEWCRCFENLDRPADVTSGRDDPMDDEDSYTEGSSDGPLEI